MKTLKILPYVLAALAAPAQAEIRTVKNDFWSTLFENRQQLGLKSLTDDLADDCAAFERRIQDRNLDRSFYARLRARPKGLSRQPFSAAFQIDASLSRPEVQARLSNASAGLPALRGKAVHASQIVEVAAWEPVFWNNEPIEIVAGPESLLAYSRSLGLEALEISLPGSGYEAAVTVTGLDAACDLLRGRAYLKLSGHADLKISADEYRRGNEFYSRIEGAYRSASERLKSPIGRAASFGYRLGLLLEEGGGNLDTAKVEDAIGLLTARFFTANFEPTSLWTRFGERLQLHYPAAQRIEGVEYQLVVLP